MALLQNARSGRRRGEARGQPACLSSAALSHSAGEFSEAHSASDSLYPRAFLIVFLLTELWCLNEWCLLTLIRARNVHPVYRFMLGML